MKPLSLFLLVFLASFQFPGVVSNAQSQHTYDLIILGVAQDGGFPHLGCQRSCCKTAWEEDSLQANVVSLALVDHKSKQWWLFEATPDLNEQFHRFQEITNNTFPYLPAGIFITHAHIGHYTGLMEMGREAMSTENIPVYVLPRLKGFLETNGPWSQLVSLKNIELHELTPGYAFALSDKINVTPFLVPHRDEYSETAGFQITTAKKSYLFIPDIDKWSKFEKDIVEEVKKVDLALVDATFYSQEELPFRDIRMIPHPLVSETISLFDKEPEAIKNKVMFIHFNHTNPLLWNPETQQEVEAAGYRIAREGLKL